MDKERVKKFLDGTQCIVLDFSAVVNAGEKNINNLLEIVADNGISVAVSDEFYANYDIINHCSNDEQKAISRLAVKSLQMLGDKDLLLNMYSVYNSNEIVKKLSGKEKICFVYYIFSEFAQAVTNFKDINTKSIIVNFDGDFELSDSYDQTRHLLDIEIDEDANDSSYYEVDNLPKTNDIVSTGDGTKVLLGKYIAGGGEGDVYECNYKSGYIVKIYKQDKLNNLRIKKMLLMEKKQIRYDGLCWPERVVFSSDGIPVGYIMKRVIGKSLSYVLDSYESVLELYPDYTKQDLILLAINVLSRIQYLHLFGVIIGDLRLNNIMISPDASPTLVDLDSCQIANLPCPAGFGDFTPAELQKVEFSKQIRSYDNESFACAVLMFNILFCGLHPYAQRNGADTIEEEIAMRSFPYPIEVDGSFDKVVFGGYDRLWRNTPYQFQQFLFDIFKKGERHNIQTMITMLETYHEFIEINKERNPDINRIYFN